MRIGENRGRDGTVMEKRRKGKKFRGEGETMGLEEGWKEKREGRAIREGRGDKNEFLFHPE